MRKCLIGLLLLLAIAALPSSTAAQDCQYHKVKLDFSSASVLAEPIEDFDFCLEVSKVVGTLNGSYLTCFYDAEFVSSSDIFGDAVEQIYAEKYYSWISTNKGDVEFIEWAWFDGDFGLEFGYAKVVGGTGDFADAFGALSFVPVWPAVVPALNLEGYICTP